MLTDLEVLQRIQMVAVVVNLFSVVPYSEAIDKLGTEFEEAVETHDICEITNSGGVCGV